MDPNACLKEIRELGEQIRSGDVRESVIEDYASAVTALDEWLAKGGFLPSAWELNRTLVFELTHEEFARLEEDVDGQGYGTRRFRVAVDAGQFKWDAGGGWTVGVEATGKVAQG